MTKLEEVKDILFELIYNQKLLILPISKDEGNIDYPRPVTPSGIGMSDDGSHILIVVHPEGGDPNYILPGDVEEETTTEVPNKTKISKLN